ncbi:hypothetical protein D6B98_33765 [Bradyrhizobium sp. LVM 105]|uniref:Uncharacterized protein n=1 Tax=Bradyrhizobium frederickii TaxID=2560054 RepID=A0A4Y9KT22_9BRAD|nr:hypothetical protein D6B98_33765 [Bradyrhizobium sp. LVM 105]TFV30357.1 hypothetical protein E4K66_35295 [Bradyrhizobium frederickii]
MCWKRGIAQDYRQRWRAAHLIVGVVARLDRAIQYAAAFPHLTDVSGILDPPLSRGMTPFVWRIARPYDALTCQNRSVRFAFSGVMRA